MNFPCIYKIVSSFRCCTAAGREQEALCRVCILVVEKDVRYRSFFLTGRPWDNTLDHSQPEVERRSKVGCVYACKGKARKSRCQLGNWHCAATEWTQKKHIASRERRIRTGVWTTSALFSLFPQHTDCVQFGIKPSQTPKCLFSSDSVICNLVKPHKSECSGFFCFVFLLLLIEAERSPVWTLLMLLRI